ncbi:hypothetical protein BGZ80_011439 [Entomortierella chlamydospora]|uniref:Peptidase A1 domain-containing protein n=1 Tax=Entomortierella chlamydospora TaxID=101097 RepID=A0A9P6N3Z7_9FUNG|nr:hypothetical protein BGZ80_011439 [Entomortierella chlamydospora]
MIIYNHDLSRWSSTSRSKRGIIGVTGSHRAVSYTVDVEVGSPSTVYTLLVDTGSSNTWVGAMKQYVNTSTSQKTPDDFVVTYGSGSVSGKEYIDQVSLGSLTIQKQSIGVASQYKGFDVGTLKPDVQATVDTVVENGFNSGLIESDIFGIYIPHSDTPNPVTGGGISFGGADNPKYTGEITYVPITSTFPASTYWGIDATFAYGTTLLGNTAGIVDTGTTLLLLADDWLQKILEATGATADGPSGLLYVPSSTVLQDFTITIGRQNFILTPQQYTVPPSYYSDIGIDSSPGNTNKYLWFHYMSSNFGQGLDFVLGLKFLEHYYSVYDIKNRQVGLATAYHIL